MEKRFSYQVAMRTAVMGVLLAFIILGGVAYLVLTGWTLRIAGTVLSREMSFVLFGLLAVLAVAILIGSGLALAAGRREIVVSPAGLRLPKGELTKSMVGIDPRDVRDLVLQQASGVRTLNVKHSGGVVKLRSSNLASLAEFEDLTYTISSVSGVVPR